MDNTGMGNAHGSDNLEKATPPNGSSVPPSAAKDDPAAGAPTVSRSPLNLGGGAAPATPGAAAPHPPASPAGSRPGMPSPARANTVARPQMPVRRPVATAAIPAPAGRITCCKTFFTKLHPGAIEFMDEQISNWLKENPHIIIKHTTAIVGEVQAKKTEPNVLITVWY
jgi:hypothetical protein